MNRRRVAVPPAGGVLLLLPFLMLAASSAAARAAAVDVEIVSDDRGLLPSYRVGAHGRHDTYRSYIEAVKGDRYGIRIRNNTDRRVAVVVAVDGRNIISGEKSYLQNAERMYVLGPRESETYDGWRTARDTVHRFYFTDPGDSYAGAFGDRSAMGVVAVAVYREETPPPARRTVGRPEGESRDGRGELPAGPGPSKERAAGMLAPESGKDAGTG
ncbi:MAG TPA: hypothetical protein VE080_00220, partial [Candidatus Aquicultoraceae bacterium]|nr:hypothetical protein [Candidatus Aquicultoraceae bacterium]